MPNSVVSDWDKGLPTDVLVLVVKAGGCLEEMKAIREVSKSWQGGFELAVTGIKLRHGAPDLPPILEAARRFPMLKLLDVGERDSSDEHGAQLAILKHLPNLNHLVLGNQDSHINTTRLAFHLSQTALAQLQEIPLTHLNLRTCRWLSNSSLAYLHQMPLLHLNLQFCPDVSDAGLAHLRNLPLTSLYLEGCWVSVEGLKHLQGVPLTALGLRNLWGPAFGPNQAVHHIPRDHPQYPHPPKPGRIILPTALISNLEVLRGMAMTELSLTDSQLLTSGALASLQGMPMTLLDLSGSGLLRNEGLRNLQGLPLASLNLERCARITDAGLQELSTLSALRVLGLGGCIKISEAGLQHLVGLPLSQLNVRQIDRLSTECLEGLAPLQEAWDLAHPASVA